MEIVKVPRCICATGPAASLAAFPVNQRLQPEKVICRRRRFSAAANHRVCPCAARQLASRKDETRSNERRSGFAARIMNFSAALSPLPPPPRDATPSPRLLGKRTFHPAKCGEQSIFSHYAPGWRVII